MDSADEKAAIRMEVLARRNRLDPEKRIEAALALAENIERVVKNEPGEIVSGFFPIRSEIDPRPAMDKLRQRGARLCLPVVASKSKIIFRELIRGASLVETGFGTFGPDATAAEVVPDWMLIPLAAFDRNGGRLGYGAGYYDRYIGWQIETGRRPLLIGVGFSVQEIERVPMENHDQMLHSIITEKEYFHTKRDLV